MRRLLRLFSRDIHSKFPYEKKITVSTPSNIAVLKYWGKLDDEYMIPLNPSISVTINDLLTTTTIYASRSYDDHSLILNGKEEEISDRVRNMINTAIESGETSSEMEEYFFKIDSENHFPTAAGLASSASGLGSIAFGLCNMIGNNDPKFWSCIARIGSGSACRSMFGGWVKWIVDDEDEPNPWFSSYGVPLYDENHWSDMRILILVVEGEEKKISSTFGMQKSRENSEVLVDRLNTFIPEIIEDLETSIKEKDYETFFSLMMDDCENFHEVCLDTTPRLEYRNETSFQICDLVRMYNKSCSKVSVGYTFDAGPNAILFFKDENVREDFIGVLNDTFEIGNFEGAQITDMLLTKIGQGPKVVESENID